LLFGVLGAVVLLGAVAIVVVATFDWNRAKPAFAATVAAATGRTIAIDGDLQVNWQRNPELGGWRRLVPTPHVIAAKVAIGNTDWARAREFIRADSVDFDVAVMPLLAHTISIHALRFVAPTVNLERRDDSHDNWTLSTSDGPAPWTLDIGGIVLDQGRFTYVDPHKAIDVGGKIEALGQSIPFDQLVGQQVRQARDEVLEKIGPKAKQRFEQRAEARERGEAKRRGRSQRYEFAWSAEGTFQKQPFKGAGKLGGMILLRDTSQPFPLLADVRIGDTHIAFVGTMTDPADLDSLDLRLWLSGSNLARLYDIAAFPMPNSPPYAMEGRLIGRFARGAKKLRYEHFTARVGSSDLSGDLDYESRQPRPLLSGKIDSDELQFRDLAPLIGARIADEKTEPGKLIPETPFHPERWRAMDADVQFTGDHVFRDSELPIHQVDARIRMDDAVLTLEPFRFRYAWGDVESKLRFDGRSAPIKATLDLTARNMQLQRLVPAAAAGELTLGRADGAAKLAASGNSIGALLGAANGQLRVVADGGTVSKALLETAGLNLPNIFLAKLFGDKQIKIDCAAADLAATNGVFDARTFVIDTDTALITVTGKVDLNNERVDLTVDTDAKGVRLLSLRSPLHIKGPFRDVDVSIDKGMLLARAAGAIGLAAVAAPAALLPLTSTNLGNDGNRCTALVSNMPKRPPATAAPRKTSKTKK
jgi:uncharacterized protein involved in outer membrane biogenesis